MEGENLKKTGSKADKRFRDEDIENVEGGIRARRRYARWRVRRREGSLEQRRCMKRVEGEPGERSQCG